MAKNGGVGALLALWLCLAQSEVDAVVAGAQNTDEYETFDVIVVEGMPAGVVHMDQSAPDLIWGDLQEGRLFHLRQVTGGWVARTVPDVIDSKRHAPGVYHVNGPIAPIGEGGDQVSIPLNYPNAIDRLQARTEGGDRLLTRLVLQPAQETQLILNGPIEWWATRPAEYEYLLTTFKLWLSAWEALNSERYFEYYAPEFTDFNQDLTEFKRHKRRVNNSKEWVKVEVRHLSAIVDPRERDVVSIRYYQNYRSSNYQWQGWKQMLWRYQDDGSWRIIFESR